MRIIWSFELNRNNIDVHDETTEMGRNECAIKRPCTKNTQKTKMFQSDASTGDKLQHRIAKETEQIEIKH